MAFERIPRLNAVGNEKRYRTVKTCSCGEKFVVRSTQEFCEKCRSIRWGRK